MPTQTMLQPKIRHIPKRQALFTPPYDPVLFDPETWPEGVPPASARDMQDRVLPRDPQVDRRLAQRAMEVFGRAWLKFGPYTRPER